jgi:uncharacterized cupin superfamily protein
MGKIIVKKLTDEEKKEMNIESWGIWEKEISTFPWSYSQEEQCYITEGAAKITDTQTGESVKIGVDDFVIFQSGLECTWEITQPIKKYYKFI